MPTTSATTATAPLSGSQRSRPVCASPCTTMVPTLSKPPPAEEGRGDATATPRPAHRPSTAPVEHGGEMVGDRRQHHALRVGGQQPAPTGSTAGSRRNGKRTTRLEL